MKVWLNVAPGARVPEPHEPSSAVTVCGALLWFVQITVVPAATVIAAGLKA